MDRADAILDYWLSELPQENWYVGSEAIDADITARFADDWHKAQAGDYDAWGSCPQKSLALILLLDQFPRNMFRGDAQAFASDKKARCVVKHAIDEGYDKRTPEPERQFFYVPLMHSESLTDQERCVRMFKTRMPESTDNLLHAKVHREVIRRFGRFPYRNEALRRKNTAAEQTFLDEGGYQVIVEDLQKAAVEA